MARPGYISLMTLRLEPFINHPFSSIPPHSTKPSITSLQLQHIPNKQTQLPQNKASFFMEGLIPYVYKAIIQYRNGDHQGPLGASWLTDSPSNSPSMSYMRLPGDSGRYRSPEIQLLSSSSISSASNTLSSPRRRSTSRKLV